MPRRLLRRIVTAAAATSLVASLAACDAIQLFPGQSDNNPAPQTSQTPAPTQTCGNYAFDSVFSAYGSVHYTLLLADKLTFYLDMFTEQKTHDWFPSADKHLSFVLKVVDSRVPIRAKFAEKRRVFMGQLQIDAVTKKQDGSTGPTAYSLHTNDPLSITLDPEALHSRQYGLLVTSPKGGFELDQIKLDAMPDDTIGFDMDFTFQLSTETKAGSGKFATHLYTATIPVAVFSQATQNESSSCATTATLAPVDGR
jgi:hypothetical protein